MTARRRLGAAERRRRVREPVLRRCPTAGATATTDFGEGGKPLWGVVLPRRGRGAVRRRRVAHADRQADAEGGVLARTTTPREQQSPASDLRAQVAVELRRRVPLVRGGDARRLLHVRLRGRVQRGGQRQPDEAADAAGPRRRAAAGQPARAPTRRAAPPGRPTRRRSTSWRRRWPRRWTPRASSSRGWRSTGSTVAVDITNRRYNQDPRAIGRTARVLQVGHAGLGRDLPHHAGAWTGCAPPPSRSTAATTRRRSTGRTPASELGDASASRARRRRCRGRAGGARPIPSFDWSIAPAPYLFLLTPEDPIRLGHQPRRRRHAELRARPLDHRRGSASR